MIVFAAGVPRSGTVLVSAILRHLLTHAGHRVAVQNPHGAQLLALLGRLDAGQATVIHTHSWDRRVAETVAATPQIRGFLNRRDPRDVCVSLMRLHDHDVDTAAPMVVQYVQMMRRAAQDTGWPVIDYARLTGDTPAHIRAIARHLGLPAPPEVVAQIAEATSVARHSAIMADVQAGRVAALTERRNSRRILREDAATLINDRHIQSGAVGRWKTELTDDEKARAATIFASLVPP